MKILGIDIDNTIWNSTEFYSEAMEEMGYHFDPTHETYWDWFFDNYPTDVVLEMFRRALAPNRIEERPLYPHVQEALSVIQHDMDVKVHFITHNADPDLLRPPLKKWIAGNFGEEAGLSVFHFKTSKLTKLKQLGAMGMVDDRADFAVEVADAGLWAASKVQLNNRDIVLQDSRIFAFNDWREVPYALALAIEERDLRKLATIGGAA